MSLEIVTPTQPACFAPTSVSQQIEDAVAFAIMTESAVAVRGRPGIGKSSTIGRLLASDDPRIAAFEIPAGHGGHRNVVKWAATALEMPSWGGQHIGAVISHVRDERRFNFSCLVIDEIQNTDAAGIRDLLSLNERAFLPLVLVGNEDALKAPKGKSAAWEQIFDRVTKIVELEAALAEDAEAVARAWGATLDDTLRVVLAFAEKHSLRKVVQLLRTARALAEGNGDITIGNIEVALRYVGSATVHRGEAA